LKYAIVTFGCRMNQAESLGLEEALRARGGESAGTGQADLVLVNTCSVTAVADQGARQMIRRIARTNPRARIVVTGCYATRRPADLDGLPGVARLVPNDDKSRLVASVGPDFGLPAMALSGDSAGACGLTIRPGVSGRTAYPLGVQTGCDERCAYCVIPATRGASRSRPLEHVIAEARRASQAGFKELVLTGVHLGCYGRDLTPRRSLVDLLRALDCCGSDAMCRISSVEPMDCSPPVLDLVAGSGRFAPHLHLPLQHASDRMLRAMRRPYSFRSYRRIVDAVRERLPDAAIGTDLIAGFPGETERDFRASLDYLDESPLTSVHVFCYSDRPGTAAAAMLPKVHGETVKQRAEALRARAGDLLRRFQSSQVGSIRRGLTLGDGSLVLTDNYLKVRVPPGRARNEWVRVHILAAGGILTGTLVNGH
jgi:threonylcarbamoyladenosine tRNA methylthiotransferase MtaB